MAAERGMTEWTAVGVDYIINDPNNAEEFKPDKDYFERDHVYHEGILHVFIDDHPAGAWNPSHVLAITVGQELANLWNANDTEATLRLAADNDFKSAFEYRAENTIDYFDSTKLQNGYLVKLDGSVSGVTGWACTGLIPVQYGDIVSFAYGLPNEPSQTNTLSAYNANYEFEEGYKPRASGSGNGSGKMVITNPNVKYIRYNVAPTSMIAYADQYLKVTTNKAFIAQKELYENGYVKDYFDSSKVVTGYLLSGTTGLPVANANYNYLDVWVPVEKGDIILFPVDYSAGNLAGIIIYDENRQMIGKFVTPTKNNGTFNLNNYYVITEDNAHYVRYNVMLSSWFSFDNQYLKVMSLQEDYTYSVDYFDKNNLVEGKIQGTAGNIVNASGYAMTQFFPVSAGDIIGYAYGWANIEGQPPAFCLYDKDFNFLESVKNTGSNGPDKHLVTNTSARYARYNIAQETTLAYKDQHFIITRTGNTCNAKDFRVVELESPVFYVGSTRSGRNGFAKLIDVCSYIEREGIKNATIYFDAEEFNIAEEYGTEYLDSYTYGSGARPGPRFGFNCHYIFSEGSKITFDYDGENSEIYTYFSPVNICGSCVIEGATIIAENCRYCVHDDLPTSGSSYVGTPYTVIYKDCNMEHVGNSSEPENSPICIGGGCNKNTRHIIEGGIYKSSNTQTDYQISYHNYNKSTYGEGQSSVIIRNAYTTKGVKYATYGDSHVDYTVCGCYIPDGIIGSSEYFTVRSWNNVINS